MISIHCNFAVHLLSCQNLSLLLSSFQLLPLGKKNQVRFNTLPGSGSGVLERPGRFIPGLTSLVEFESAQVTEKKRTVYQMALSKRAHVCQWMYPEPPPLFLTHLHQVCLFPRAPFFGLLMSHFFCLIAVCLLLSCLFLPLLFLSDKLDEILAAAQQTISTNEAPGTRGQGPKRDRGRSFYGNEVCF